MSGMRWLRSRIPWIAGIVVGGFIVWQITTAVTLRTSGPGSPGRLFGKPVSAQQFLKAMDAATREAILSYGDRFREQVPREDLERRAWERLLLLAEARRKGIRVTDREVIENLQQEPLFQTQGRFDPKSYQSIIRYSLGATPRLFEEETRERLVIAKLLEQAMGEPKATEEEIREAFRKKEESIRVETLLLPDPSLAREVADACRQEPAQMERVAQQLKLQALTSDFFKRSETSQPPAAAAIFESLFGKEPGAVSPSLPGAEGWVVARLLERKPADEALLPASRDELEKEVVSRKRLTNYFTWYQDLTQRAQ